MAKSWRIKPLNLLVGQLLMMAHHRKSPPDQATLKKQDFSHNTQRMGMRFSERIRDVWRNRWLKLKP